MGFVAIILWTFAISLILYHPSSPVAMSSFGTSVKSILPSFINTFFEGIYPPSGNTIIASQAGMQKLGQVSCQSDNSCAASYPSYKITKCDIPTGFCYGSVY